MDSECPDMDKELLRQDVSHLLGSNTSFDSYPVHDNGCHKCFHAQTLQAPVFVAARRGHSEVVTLLLKASSNPNEKDEYGQVSPCA